MGCTASQQKRPPTQPKVKLSESTWRHCSEAMGSQNTFSARRTCRSTILDTIEEGIDQLNGEETRDIMLGVAAEADTIDLGMKPMIAMVSHDNMKPLMASFAKSYSSLLRDFRLTGTGTTCKMLRAIELEPEGDVPSGPLGGDQVLGSMICEGHIRALFFFQDPLSSHAHAADIAALSRLCDVYQIYFATNYRSAGALLEQLHRNLGKTQGSIRVEDGMSTDLGKIVQEKYKQTRQAAVAAAAGDQKKPTPAAATDEITVGPTLLDPVQAKMV